MTRHLILPGAVSSSDGWLPAMQALPPASTRHIESLLRGMVRVQIDVQSPDTLSPPHERAAALAWGLVDSLNAADDGLLPWAALEALSAGLPGAAAGTGWGIITPCHWAMGREQATLTDPAVLGLDAHDSQTLIAAMQPYFETDGITLHAWQPGRWLAQGEVFRTLPTTSLDRVMGRDVDHWLPTAPGSKLIKRLQNEMQMLLYTHTVNDARAAQRKLPVNSFWLSGTGALPAGFSPKTEMNVEMPRNLLDAAFAEDWAACAAAWQALDSGVVRDALQQQQSGQPSRLSLAGERGFETWESRPATLGKKAADWLTSKGILASRRIYNRREQL